MSSITIYGRATQGVIVMKVDNGEKVVTITKVKSEDDERDEVSTE